ncbi:MAG: SnoaL-like polyketide cyclase, partial [Thermoleophilaceae bacterium]|nr:SnoaL-like polyketide cyclase [Thermoleophilaceae bacterium]
DASTFRGHEGALALLEKLSEVFPGMKFLPTSILENGDVVLVEVTWIGRGAASSAPMELKLFHVWRFVGNRAMTIHAFVDEQSAAANAGLLT